MQLSTFNITTSAVDRLYTCKCCCVTRKVVGHFSWKTDLNWLFLFQFLFYKGKPFNPKIKNTSYFPIQGQCPVNCVLSVSPQEERCNRIWALSVYYITMEDHTTIIIDTGRAKIEHYILTPFEHDCT